MISIFLEMAKAVLAGVPSDDLTDHVFLQERVSDRMTDRKNDLIIL